MALSDIEIWAELEAGFLSFDPEPPDDHIDASSIDLRLHDELTLMPPARDVSGVIVDPTDVVIERLLKTQPRHSLSKQGSFDFEPGQFVLGFTMESINLPNHLSARIEGKSSLGRLGLGVHVTAPTVQAGWEGRLRLEMLNSGPYKLRLQSGMRIAQLILERVGIPARSGYSGQFQGQRSDS